MISPFRRFVLLILLSCLATTAVSAADIAKLRVLIVGNSFSGNALQFLGDIAKADGRALEVKHLMIGGSSLEVHWTMAEAALKDPTDLKGRYGDNGRFGSLPEGLDKGPWDVVTIQQHSQKSSDAATFHPFIGKLVGLIRERAPKARLMIHQTWAYRNDDTQFGTGPKNTMPSSEVMYQRISAAYAAMATEFSLEVIPCAEAFQMVATDPAWKFTIDPAWDKKTAVFPALPDQRRSLNVGWSWSTGKDGANTLGYDPKHANANGQYLAGCVWYESLFRRGVVGNGFQPKEVPAEDVAYLQKIAHAAVERGIPGMARK